MTKFIYCAPPRYGHVLPVLTLIKELTNQGADITFFCIEQLADTIQQAGATFKPYKTTILDAVSTQDTTDFELESSDPTINECFYVLPQILEVARAEKAD